MNHSGGSLNEIDDPAAGLGSGNLVSNNMHTVVDFVTILFF